MQHLHRLKTRAEQLDRAADRFHLHLRQPAELIVCVENVAEHVADEISGIGTGIKRQLSRLVMETQWPQIVDAQNVVSVGVGIEHGIQLMDLLADRSEEHTSELQSPCNLVCRLLLEKKKEYKRFLL